jgi:hypothetical protein
MRAVRYQQNHAGDDDSGTQGSHSHQPRPEVTCFVYRPCCSHGRVIRAERGCRNVGAGFRYFGFSG